MWQQLPIFGSYHAEGTAMPGGGLCGNCIGVQHQCSYWCGYARRWARWQLVHLWTCYDGRGAAVPSCGLCGNGQGGGDRGLGLGVRRVPILWIFDGWTDADAFEGIALRVSMVSKVSKVFCPIGILIVFPIS